jgi:tetrahydromethanopterin S-methyltransferase subunit A
MNPTFKKVYSEIQRGMRLSKCKKCGCMRGTLENLKASLPLLKLKDASELLQNVNKWFDQLEPLEYPCFGCKYCIPPEAMTILTSKYPVLASATLSSCEMQVNEDSWPPVEGEYTVLDKSAPVAVSTLASVRLDEKLAKLKPEGLCMVGKTETENIGVDKIIKNVISNPSISTIIVAGKDTEGHQSGRTLLALWENGVDKNMRVIGSNGRRPILKNVSMEDVDIFRKQITVEDMIGSENTRSLAKKIRELSEEAPVTSGVTGCGCHSDCCDTGTVAIPAVMLPQSTMSISTVKAKKQSKSSIKLDKAGYFVILPQKKKATILVEHYSYDNKLIKKIEGKSSRDIYLTIINNRWVTELSHAAYLGKELSRAELSIKNAYKFVQDGA